MAIFFPYRPDWKRDFSVESSFKTEIITSRLKREQRSADRQQPRKTLEFDIKVSRGGWTEFQAFIIKNQQGRFWVTDWTRWTTLSAGVAIADDTLLLTDVPAWMVPGQQLLLVSGDNEKLVQMDAVGLTDTLMAAPITQAFPAGTRVYLVYDCTMDQRVKAKVLTNTVAQVSMVFYVKPGTTMDDDGTAPVAFNGRELFLTKPNWASPPSLEFIGFMETVDFDIGVTDEYAPVAFNLKSMQCKFSFRSNAKVEEFYEFFMRQKGRRGEFYMSTGQYDVSTDIGAAAGLSRLDVPGSSFLAVYGNSTVYKAVMVYFNDGSYQVNKITGITLSGVNSRIAFASPWVQAVNADTVQKISFLPVWRFNGDDLTLDWITNYVAETQMTFVMQEDLP